MRNFFKTYLLRYRFIFIFLFHLMLILGSNYLAFLLRFDGEIPRSYYRLMKEMFVWLLAIRVGTFFYFGLFRGLWRYTGIWDLWRIVFATLLSSFAFLLVVRFAIGNVEYPRSVYAIDSILLIFFLGGVRLPWRIYRDFSRKEKGKRVLIYGAGDAGEMIARDMKQHPEYQYNPVGFIDDNRSKVGQSIHGIPVLGTRNSMDTIIFKKKIEEVIFAIPSADPSIRREVFKHMEKYHIPIKTTPNLIDILDEKVTVSQIRNLAIEDLMTRVPVDLDLSGVKKMLEGKRVFVSGAGGSIGSELCR